MCNAQAQAEAQQACAPAKKPRAAVAPAEQQTPPLQPSWIAKPSRSRPGKLSYVQTKCDVKLAEPPHSGAITCQR